MTSNCFIENLSLFSNLDKAVFVPYKVNKNKEYPLIIDNKIFAFILKDDKYPKFVEEIKKWTKKEIIQKEFQMLDIMKMALREKYDGIVFHDVIKNNDFFTETFVDYNDIYKKRNTIEIVDWLQKQLTIKDHSSKVTLINLLDKHFSYAGDLNDDNNYFIEMPPKNSDLPEKKLMRIFSSQSFAGEFKTANKISGEITTETLRNILGKLNPDIDIVIDIGRPYGTSIARNVLEEAIFQSEDSWNRENIKDRVDYFNNLDEFYIIASPCCDYDNGLASFSCLLTQYNKREHLSLGVFESLSDAQKHIDATVRENVENVRAIGLINNHEEFEKLLQRAYTLGIKHITFDYATNHQLTLKISDFYEKFFSKKFIHNKIEEVVAFKLVDNPPKKHLLDEQKSSYEFLTQGKLNRLIAEGSCEELLFTISLKIKELQNYTKNPADKFKMEIVNSQINTVLLTLIKKLGNKKHIHLVIHPETRELLLHKSGSPFLQIETKYITNPAEIVDFDFCNHSIESLKESYKKIIFTNNKNAGQEIPIQVVEAFYNEIKKDEIDRSKIMIYLTYVCDLTIDEANMLYDLFFAHKPLMSEFKKFVFDGGNIFTDAEKPYTIKEKTAEMLFKEKRFSKKYMAYLEMAEMLCQD